jgi:hypothetical protein
MKSPAFRDRCMTTVPVLSVATTGIFADPVCGAALKTH